MARLFDAASSEYLTVASVPVSAPALTIAGWFYRPAYANGIHTICELYNSSTNYFRLATDYSNYLFWQVDGAGGADLTTSATASISYETWYHGCGVSSSTTDRAVYLNGTNKNTGNGQNLAVSAPTATYVGASGGPGNYFPGTLAEVGIWAAALTDAEIAVLATGVSPLAVRPESLVFYAPLWRDEDEDFVGGISLTAMNTPSIAAHPRVFYLAPQQLGVLAAAAAGDIMQIATVAWANVGQVAGVAEASISAIAGVTAN